MNRKMRKDYIDFETSELLTGKELKVLASNNTPLAKAELLANKLWERIAIINNTIYIKYIESYETSNIIGDEIHSYVSIIVRKLVDQSVCKYISSANRDTFLHILQRKYYEDIIDDIEYMLQWEGNDESNEEDDELEDEVKSNEYEYEDNDEEEEDDIFSKYQTKVSVVDSIEGIIEIL